MRKVCEAAEIRDIFVSRACLKSSVRLTISVDVKSHIYGFHTVFYYRYVPEYLYTSIARSSGNEI